MFEITAQLSIIFLIIIFLISLVALIKGADFLILGAERVGKYFKLPAFVIGALIIGIGTSLPELASSFAAAFSGETSIVAANAVGSNITNILLVAGLSAVVGGVIISTKNLIRLEIPLLVISTSLFIFIAYDGTINIFESIIVFLAFLIYLHYLLNYKKYLTKAEEKEEQVYAENNSIQVLHLNKEEEITKIGKKEWFLLIFGAFLLSLGANYLIDSLIAVSEKFSISPEIIALSAVALGTSLPEILVSIKAVLQKKTDLAFGNIFGSNVFNMMMITGVVGLFYTLEVDSTTLTLGLPFLAVTTLVFYVSAMAKKIYIWEGLMFLLFYVLFSLKIFGII